MDACHLFKTTAPKKPPKNLIYNMESTSWYFQNINVSSSEIWNETHKKALNSTGSTYTTISFYTRSRKTSILNYFKSGNKISNMNVTQPEIFNVSMKKKWQYFSLEIHFRVNIINLCEAETILTQL